MCSNTCKWDEEEKNEKNRDICTYIKFGGLSKDTIGVDVVVEDDDSSHDTKTQHQCIRLSHSNSETGFGKEASANVSHRG